MRAERISLMCTIAALIATRKPASLRRAGEPCGAV